MSAWQKIDLASNAVVNVEEWDSTPSEQDGLLYLQQDGAGIGWTWNGSELTEPLPPPVVAPVPQAVSDRQFFQALALQGMISNAEALAAVKTGEIPLAMANFIATMPADQQFNAQMLLAGATVFERSNALVPAFMAAQTPPMTGADIDALWTFAGSL